MWTPRLVKGTTPLYLALADALAADVANGRLRNGARLPPQRELARLLDLDLTTVTRALGEASRRGLVVSEGRRGTFVRARPHHPGGHEVSLEMNMPPEPPGGRLAGQIARDIDMILKRGSAPLHYQPSAGTEAQRASSAGFLAELIPGTQADQVLLTSGSQNGLHAALSFLTRPGDRIAAGCFTYPGLLKLARRGGVEVVALAMDGEGIVPEALDRAARTRRLKAVYAIATNDNPTSATMGVERRRAIAEIARRHGLKIIEDDAYGRLPERPLAPLASFAPELTWHLLSFSKLVSPSLRVGFLKTPSARDSIAAAALIHETAVMAPPLNAALVTEWIDSGAIERLIAEVRQEASLRMREAVAILRNAAVDRHPEGYHLWMSVAAGINSSEVAAQLARAGVPAVSSAAFAVDPADPRQAIRLSLGGPSSRQRVYGELRRIDAMLAHPGEANLV